MLIGVSADGTRTPALLVTAAVKPSTGDTPTLTIKQRMRHKVPGAKKQSAGGKKTPARAIAPTHHCPRHDKALWRRALLFRLNLKDAP